MEFNNIEELIDCQKNEINKSMKEVNKEIRSIHKKYNLFLILYYRLTMRSRLKRRVNKPYIRSSSEF